MAVKSRSKGSVHLLKMTPRSVVRVDTPQEKKRKYKRDPRSTRRQGISKPSTQSPAKPPREHSKQKRGNIETRGRFSHFLEAEQQQQVGEGTG
jgi:hypothetical protein